MLPGHSADQAGQAGHAGQALAASDGKTAVAVFGAAGYSGALLCDLLRGHPAVRVAVRAADRQGEAAALEQIDADPVAVALLATPAESSLHLASALLRRGLRVLDLSGAFRLSPAEAAATYKLTYEDASLFEEVCYSLPELPEVSAGRDPRAARLVANPGCYVTAALLALAPLARRGLIDREAPLFIDGKSGASGAGRKALLELTLSELEGDIRPYRLGDHQHTPEIAQGLARLGAPLSRLRFVPHIVGTRRGLLVTCHGQLVPGTDAAAVHAAYAADYPDREPGPPRVLRLPPPAVTLRRAAFTADACVGVHVDGGGGTFCALGGLDNLLKGAASQAVQNLNLMLGLPVATGLTDRFTP